MPSVKKMKTVYIHGAEIETIIRDGIEYVQGAINGEPFEVPCNQITEVSPQVAAVLEGILIKQRGLV